MSITIAMTERARQYLETAIWADLRDSETGEPMDSEYDATDAAPETVAAVEAELADFFAANEADIAETGAGDGRTAHDFYLTRCGHGAGFWDRGYGPVGDRLTDAAKAYGSVYPYLGDDGRVYITNG